MVESVEVVGERMVRVGDGVLIGLSWCKEESICMEIWMLKAYAEVLSIWNLGVGYIVISYWLIKVSFVKQL